MSCVMVKSRRNTRRAGRTGPVEMFLMACISLATRPRVEGTLRAARMHAQFLY